MNRYAVGLGSNQGDRLENLVSAVAGLRELGELEALSGLYETEPVGGPEQDPFLNAVAVVSIDLEPPEVLDRLQGLEQAHGRERTIRWGPRTLDLDILTYDGDDVSTNRLTVPHPRAAERGFVLRPLCDVWADASVASGLTASRALEAVGDEGVDRLAGNWLPPIDPWPARLLVTAQFVLFAIAAIALVIDGRLPSSGVTFVEAIGAILACSGMVLAVVATLRLGPAMTVNPVPRSGAQLVVTGPFRLVRHPIYGAVLLILLGTAVVLGSLWGGVVCVALGVFFWFKSSYEERRLRMTYAGYRAYKSVVRRRLVPFLL